jgi:hypothetical protein
MTSPAGGHGLHVEPVPRERYARAARVEAGSETCGGEPGSPAPWRAVELRVDLDTRQAPHAVAENLRTLLLADPGLAGVNVTVENHTSACGECEGSPAEHDHQYFETWQRR